MKRCKPRIDGPEQRAARVAGWLRADDARDAYARLRVDEDLRARGRRKRLKGDDR